MGRTGDQRIVEIDTIQLRHDEVAHHGVDAGVLGQSLERVAAGLRLPHRKTPVLENPAERTPNWALVVYQEDGRHEAEWATRLMGSPMQTGCRQCAPVAPNLPYIGMLCNRRGVQRTARPAKLTLRITPG